MTIASTATVADCGGDSEFPGSKIAGGWSRYKACAAHKCRSASKERQRRERQRVTAWISGHAAELVWYGRVLLDSLGRLPSDCLSPAA